MNNHQQREQVFLNELLALQEKYGCQVVAQLDAEVEKLGTAVLVKPVAQLVVAFDTNWQPASNNGTRPAVVVTTTDPAVVPEVVSG